jgi:hypothetical protein
LTFSCKLTSLEPSKCYFGPPCAVLPLEYTTGVRLRGLPEAVCQVSAVSRLARTCLLQLSLLTRKTEPQVSHRNLDPPTHPPNSTMQSPRLVSYLALVLLLAVCPKDAVSWPIAPCTTNSKPGGYGPPLALSCDTVTIAETALTSWLAKPAAVKECKSVSGPGNVVALQQVCSQVCVSSHG